jgi:hypothetical protein
MTNLNRSVRVSLFFSLVLVAIAISGCGGDTGVGEPETDARVRPTIRFQSLPHSLAGATRLLAPLE